MSERVTVEYVWEYWDCPNCGRKAIRGDRTTCPDCGTSRGDDITFYRKELDEVIYDEKQIEELTQGPDWVCSFCSTLNSQTLDSCRGCGSTRESSTQNYFDILNKRKERESASGPPSPPPADGSGSPGEDGNGGKKGLWKVFAGIGGGVLVVAGLLFWGLSTTEVPYIVTDKEWSRSIVVLRYQWSEKNGWQNELTGDDIRKISEKREVRSYEKRQVGTKAETYTETERYQSGTKEECTVTYESTGSGAAKKVTKCRDVPVYKTREVEKSREVPVYREFPVYDTMVTYRSKSYVKVDTLKTSGTTDPPEWPEFKPGIGVDGKPDRKGLSLEQYIVTLKKDKKEGKGTERVRITTTGELFTSRYAQGKILEMEINNFGQLNLREGEEILSEKDQ